MRLHAILLLMLLLSGCTDNSSNTTTTSLANDSSTTSFKINSNNPAFMDVLASKESYSESGESSLMEKKIKAMITGQSKSHVSGITAYRGVPAGENYTVVSIAMQDYSIRAKKHAFWNMSETEYHGNPIILIEYREPTERAGVFECEIDAVEALVAPECRVSIAWSPGEIMRMTVMEEGVVHVNYTREHIVEGRFNATALLDSVKAEGTFRAYINSNRPPSFQKPD